MSLSNYWETVPVERGEYETPDIDLGVRLKLETKRPRRTHRKEAEREEQGTETSKDMEKWCQAGDKSAQRRCIKRRKDTGVVKGYLTCFKGTWHREPKKNP